MSEDFFYELPDLESPKPAQPDVTKLADEYMSRPLMELTYAGRPLFDESFVESSPTMNLFQVTARSRAADKYELKRDMLRLIKVLFRYHKCGIRLSELNMRFAPIAKLHGITVREACAQLAFEEQVSILNERHKRFAVIDVFWTTFNKAVVSGLPAEERFASLIELNEQTVTMSFVRDHRK